MIEFLHQGGYNIVHCRGSKVVKGLGLLVVGTQEPTLVGVREFRFVQTGHCIVWSPLMEVGINNSCKVLVGLGGTAECWVGWRLSLPVTG